MPFGMHWYDLAIVLVVALLVLGPKKLPEMGSSVGKMFKEFKKSASEIGESIKLDAAKQEASTPALPKATATIEQPVETVK